jgi:hypothetical protein
MSWKALPVPKTSSAQAGGLFGIGGRVGWLLSRGPLAAG